MLYVKSKSLIQFARPRSLIRVFYARRYILVLSAYSVTGLTFTTILDNSASDKLIVFC